MAVEIPVIVKIADGIDDAIKNQLPKAMRDAQVAMSKNSLGLKFHIDDNNLAKVETILMDTTLKANQLARALQEVNAEISKKKAGGAKFTGNNVSIKNRALLEAQTALQMKYDALAWGEQYASKQADNLADSQDRVDKSNKKVSSSTQEVNKNLKNTNNHIANLIKNSIRLIAIHAATRFIRNLREVTAEFEMQRVALAGIIQDTAEAESLFKKLKAAAIQSPFEIKDLVTFTKQLSAYRIETDKLYDVTMRLADISAGLGVDMSRLVLAYGQVRAASVLRGQELRQFTEAGIPLVELLAEKFRELGQEGTTTADVFELISKRAVPFKMIEEIFQDMTSAGGAFYKMQEKQSETLKGQWMKLKDAASIMYDEMGNTEAVHKAMESMLSDAMTLLQSWRKVAGVAGGLGAAFAINQLLSLIPGFTQKTTLAKKAVDGLVTSLKSVGTWVGLAVTAIFAIIGYVIQLRKEANRLNNEIESARVKGDIQIEQSLRNFRRLADAAVSAAHGSAEQRDALKELQRTYGDIIPAQDLEIEKLRELQGNYESLTRAISEKIQMQVHEQNLNQIQDTYGNQIANIQKNIKKALIDDAGLSREEAGRYISAVMEEIRNGLIGPLDDATDIFVKMRKIAAEQIGPEKDWQAAAALTESANFWGKTYFSKLLDVVPKMNDALEEENSYFKSLNNSLGKYSDMVKELRKNAQRVPEGFTLEQTGSFEYNQALWKQRLDDYKKALVQMFGDTDISDAFETAGTINFKKIIDKISSEKGTGTLKAAVNELQKDYLNFAPQEKTTRLVTEAAIGFADSVGIAMTKVQGYLKKDGQKMDEYAKSVEDFVNAQKLRVQTKEFEYKNWSPQADWVRPTNEDIQNEKDELNFLEKLLAFVQEFLKAKNTGGSGQDPWIILFKNRMKFMQDFQKGVEDLDQYMAHSASLGREQDIMKGRGLSLGIDTKQLSGDANELRKWYSSAIKEVVKKIQELGGKQFTGLDVTEILAKDLTGRKIQKYQELLQELWKGLTDFDTNQIKKNLEDSLKRVTDEIKHSETVSNFYNNILGLTGDEKIANDLTVSVYGDVGKEFADRIKEQLVGALESLDKDSISKLEEDIRNAFKTGDYEYLMKNLERVPKELRDIVKQVASDSEQYNAGIIENLIKTLQKAKTYGDKRVEIAKKSAKRIAEINAREIPQPQKDKLIKQNAIKEAEETARAQYEAFRESPMYIELFENLEGASTRMLKNMKTNLESLKEQWKNLSPRELRELQTKLDDVEKQLATRNPFKSLINSIKEYSSLSKTMSRAKADLNASTLTDQANTQKAALEVAAKNYEAIKNKEGATKEEIAAAKKALDIQAEATDKAMEQAEAAQKTANSYRIALKHIEDAANGMKEWTSYVSESLSGIGEIVSTFASDETAETFNIVSQGVEKTLGGLTQTAGSAARLLAGDFTAIPSLIKGIGETIAGIFGTAQQLKINAANKTIEEQNKLIADLEYSYGRLEKAIEKSFGSDYIANYRQQLNILRAEADAYRAQAEAERSKGKKANEDTAQEFEESERDVEDKIREMASQVSEFMSGTDLTSAAKDFASAWIDAYKEFGNTTDAMKEKFHDMIENMVVNSLAAQLIQGILKPVFKAIDDASEDGALTAADIATISAMIPERLNMIDGSMNTLMNQLTAAGVNLRQQAGALTGISRDIAGASEESINGLAAGINTQNFYMQHIDMNVTAILAALTGGGTSAQSGTTGEFVDPYKDAMLSYAQHIPDIHVSLLDILGELRSVITLNGTKRAVEVKMS